MRKCMMNAVSLGCVAIGSFLLGGALGLALSKDESDIFDENCVKMEDLDCYVKLGPPVNVMPALDPDKEIQNTPITGEGTLCSEYIRDEAKESYDRMVNKLYGPYRNQIVYPESYYTNNEDYDEAENESYETTTIVDDGVTLKPTSEGLEEVTEPYIISEDDYFDPNQYPEFAQENLVYYAKDDVLTTERDEVIVNVEDIVGPDALTSFGSLTVDKDTVFVRNIGLGMEYEVTRDEGSYQEVVLGYSDEDEERAYQKAKQYFKKLEKEEEGVTT